MTNQDKLNFERKFEKIVNELNQQRCIMLALTAIVAALPDKSAINRDEVRKMIRSCHIFGEETSTNAVTAAAVEKIVGQVLG